MLELIKEELENLGYYCYEKNEVLFSGIKGGEGPIEGTFVLNNTFSINLMNKITINYLVGQISTENEFKTIEELLKFVRHVFPVEN
ncbi:hypothetical protein KB553_15945 [Chryseobacterium rhizoplanae]|uniref:hypothetical protein n=1 Tax=Chryseobacterium rhizoplanae TaxID=1609531 RepID=UPI001CE274C8|nr:hypothetical protein [Chryseobacterium rhizoplanae]UCA58533.1 hypothetical protein KB553_15945 [Chryseobacterium rhizoplanae]